MVKGFKSLKGVKQLHSGLPHGVARLTKLIGVLDGEFDPVYRDPSLVGHFKFNR
jgi:hypothetical protein